MTSMDWWLGFGILVAWVCLVIIGMLTHGVPFGSNRNDYV